MIRISLTSFALTAALAAQGTVTDGNVTYTTYSPGAAPTDSPSFDFTGNPGGDTDVGFEHGWYYRIDADPEEIPLLSTVNLTQAYAGSHGDMDISDVGSRGLISSELDIDVISAGATSGMVIHKLTVTNISLSPIVLNLYTYVDMDIISTSNTSTAGNPHTAASGAEVIEVLGIGADHWTVKPYSGSECGIIGGGPIVLDDANTQAQPGDYSSAAQWQDRTLTPFASITVYHVMCHNCRLACGVAPASESYGAGSAGAAGTPVLSSGQLPLLGATATLNVTGGLGGAPGAMLIGSPRAASPISNVTLWLLPFASPTLNLDAAGSGSMSFTVPIAPALCGGRLDFEHVFVDASVGPLPIVHTNAIEWTIGG